MVGVNGHFFLLDEIYERFCFNKLEVEEELFEIFYADLQRLIKTCNEWKDSIMRDRIVLGI